MFNIKSISKFLANALLAFVVLSVPRELPAFDGEAGDPPTNSQAK